MEKREFEWHVESYDKEKETIARRVRLNRANNFIFKSILMNEESESMEGAFPFDLNLSEAIACLSTDGMKYDFDRYDYYIVGE